MRKGKGVTRKGEAEHKEKRESKRGREERVSEGWSRVAWGKGFERATERKVQNNKVVKMI